VPLAAAPGHHLRVGGEAVCVLDGLVGAVQKQVLAQLAAQEKE